jgi:hypothetical protein
MKKYALLALPCLVLAILIALYYRQKTNTLPALTEQDMMVLVSAQEEAATLIDVRRTHNNRIIAQIRKQIENQEQLNNQDVQWLQTAKQVQTLTDDMIRQINQLKAEAIESTGGANPDNGTYQGLMTKPQWKQETITELHQQLEVFSKKMMQLAGVDYLSPILPDVGGNPMQASDLAKHYFDSPLPILLYNLSTMSALVAAQEQEAIFHISQKINFIRFNFNFAQPLVRTQKLLLTEGERYEAQVFVVATDTNLPLEIEPDEGEVVKKDKGYFIRLTAQARPEEYSSIGLVQKKLSGKVRIRLPNGQDTTLHYQEPYIIRKKIALETPE